VFVSAGGYHHHVGLNVWDSLNAPPAPINSAGLEQFVIELPAAELARVKKNIEIAGVQTVSEGDGFIVFDPWQTKIRITQRADS